MESALKKLKAAFQIQVLLWGTISATPAMKTATLESLNLKQGGF